MYIVYIRTCISVVSLQFREYYLVQCGDLMILLLSVITRVDMYITSACLCTCVATCTLTIHDT